MHVHTLYLPKGTFVTGLVKQNLPHSYNQIIYDYKIINSLVSSVGVVKVIYYISFVTAAKVILTYCYQIKVISNTLI